MSRTFASPQKADPRRARPPKPLSATKAPSSPAPVREIVTGRRLQPKLTIGAPNDRYEREADRFADQVMRMPTPVTGEAQAPDVQRMCAECEDEPLQRQPLEDEEELVQTKAASVSETGAPFIQRMCTDCEQEQLQRQGEEEEELVQAQGLGGAGHRIAPETENEIRSLPSGRPLASAERGFFESRIGHDFRRVRVHTDLHAIEMANALNAEAFTTGTHIYLNQGRYNPESRSGKRLLAHELTHVVQQSARHDDSNTSERRARGTGAIGEEELIRTRAESARSRKRDECLPASVRRS